MKNITKTGKYVDCEFCGKTVYKTLSQYNKRTHHFCSNKCQAQKKRELLFEHRDCEICGKDIYVSKKSTQRFCSIECQKVWQRGNTGFKNKRFRGGVVKCELCGVEFLVGQNIYEDNRHHFCSNKCRREWYSTVWSQSEEWSKTSRERAVKILSDNPVITQTKPQILVNNMLKELSIEYRNEEPFTYFSIDNYLPEYNLAIEVMGDYWHTSPLKYSECKNDRQKNIVSRDKAKRTYLKNQYGIDILYLWESDIIKKYNLCKLLIAEYINNNGNLANYNSFNYDYKDNDILLKENIIYSYQERQIAC